MSRSKVHLVMTFLWAWFVLPFTASFGTLQGIDRLSEYVIHDDGSVYYNVNMLLYNDEGTTGSWTATWLFRTPFVSTISTTGLVLNEDWEPVEEGFQRPFTVEVPPLSYHTYTVQYWGPPGYWNFVEEEGMFFYGDGRGGCESSFWETFTVNLTLPPSATEFQILEQSSSYNIIGSNPITLQWVEHQVDSVKCNVLFWGPDLNPTPSILTGQVTDASTAQPIACASVRVVGRPGLSDQADASGHYEIYIPPGEQQIEAEATGYESGLVNLNIPAADQVFQDFSLLPVEASIRYVGPTEISGQDGSVVIGEPDHRITCGDHVLLRLPFENIGGPATSVEVILDNAVAEFGTPEIWFSLDGEAGNWYPYLTVQLSNVDPGETVIAEFWVYIENLDYEERDIPEGRNQTIYVWYNEAQWPPDASIEIDLELVDFAGMVPQNEEVFLQGDCLSNPRGTKISRYAQYAAGESRVEAIYIDDLPILDPDDPSKAAYNVKSKIYWEFTKDEITGRTQPRLWDEILLARRNKDGATGLKLGICKDFADLQNSVLRSLSIPTRRVYGQFWPICGECLPLNYCLSLPPLATLHVGGGHEWNEVLLGSDTLYIDATWGFMEPHNVSNKCKVRPPGYPECQGPNPVRAEIVALAHTNSWALEGCYPACYDEVSCDMCVSPPLGHGDEIPLSDCLQDRYSQYGPNCAGLLSSVSAQNLFFSDSLVLDISMPTFLQQGDPFDLCAIIDNIGSISVESLFVVFPTKIYADDTVDFYQVSDSIFFLDLIEPHSIDTVSLEVTPMGFGESIPLSVWLFSGGIQLFDVVLQNVNEAGTNPDFITKCLLDSKMVAPGSYNTIKASVTDTCFLRVHDAVVSADIVSLDEPGCAQTIALNFNDFDSLYYGSIHLPAEVPLGTYVCRVTAEKSGFETDSTLAYFSMWPNIYLDVSCDTVLYNTSDTLNLTATVWADFWTTDSLLMDAGVEAALDLTDDTVVVSLTFDTTCECYRKTMLWRDLASNSPQGTLPSGTWVVPVFAWWNGREAKDTIIFNLEVPDLSVSPEGIHLIPGIVEESTFVYFVARVNNVGDCTSDSSSLAFYLDGLGELQQISADLKIPPISPDSSFFTEVRWFSGDQLGSHTVYVMVDPESTTLQSSRENDLATRGFTIVFTTGDVNGDALINLSDAIYLLNYLFKGGPEPLPNLRSGDVNCDSVVNLSDVVYLLNFLFKNGPPPCGSPPPLKQDSESGFAM